MSHADANRVWVPDPGWLRPEGGPQGERLSGRFLLLITLIAAAARLYRLGFQPLWVDEEMTWSMLRPGAGLDFWEQLRDQIQGPLYLALTWPLARLGFSEAWLRLPAALAGIAAVPALALLAQRLAGGRTARLAGLLLALSPFHLWYSQEARGYTLLMLGAVLASLAFLRLVERPGPGRAAAYAAAAAVVGWSNLSGLSLIAAHFLTLVVSGRPAGRRAWGWCLGAFAAAGAAVAPWLLQASGILAVGRLVPGAEVGPALRGATTFSPFAYPFTIYSFFFGFSLGPSLAELHAVDRLAVLRPHWPLLAAAGLVTATVLVAGAARLGRRSAVRLGLWIGVPLLLTGLMAWRNFKPFNPRYLAAVAPLVLLVAAHGLASLPRRLGRLAGVALLALSLWSLYNYHADPRYAKEDLRDAGSWLSGRSDPGDPVLVPVVTNVFSLYYPGPGQVVPFWEQPPVATLGEARALLRAKMGGAARGFLVLSRAWEIDPGGLLPDALAAEATVTETAVFPGVRVFAWRREAPAAGGVAGGAGGGGGAR